MIAKIMTMIAKPVANIIEGDFVCGVMVFAFLVALANSCSTPAKEPTTKCKVDQKAANQTY
jgi:hypothetical protein